MTKIYLYDLINHKYLDEADSMEEFIAHLAITYNYVDYHGKVFNSVLNDYNCTMEDTKAVLYYSVSPFEEASYELRQYVAFDSNMRIIDLRDYQKNIFNCPDDIIQKYRYHSPAWYRREKEKPEFRNGPVPRTGKWLRRYYGYRKVRTTGERRLMTDPEYGKYIRARRHNIPDTWDDIPREFSKSWKDQSKKRKQWM